MSLSKILLATIASAWFFPISCTGTLFAGTYLVAGLDAREASNEEPVHDLFSFVVESKEHSEPVLARKLDELPAFEKKVSGAGLTDKYSFVMSRPNGRIELDHSVITYQIIEESASGQVIEVIEHYRDGDNTIWSRYQATPFGVAPISSRMFYFGYMFEAFPYALVSALFVYGIGRFMKQRHKVSGAPHVDS